MQEAIRPDVVKRLAASTGLATWAALPGHSLAFMSRLDIAHHAWHRPAWSRHHFLEIEPAGMQLRVFGLHLSAVHSNWTERRRVYELRALLNGIQHHQNGFHVLAGDFNTLAPGELLDVQRLPSRLRALAWLSGPVRWKTIQTMLEAQYADGYRVLNPQDGGFTFPTWSPHIRLDYVFLPTRFMGQLRRCQVVDAHPDAVHASDHFPLLAEFGLA
jgi:exodeoxyribonuclease-3